jgi:multidrug efflux system membrane fusion protein
MAQANDSVRLPDNATVKTPSHAQDHPQLLLPPGHEVKALPPPRRSRKWFWITLAALLLLAFLIFRGFRGGNAPNAGKKAPAQGAAITVAQVKTGDMNAYIEALGTVTPINTVTIYSQITGRVMAVYYHEGQIVHQGDPLIDIDPRPYEATLAQAQGSLDHDRGLLAEARIDLQRYQTAFSKNAIARQQMEDQEQVVVQYEGTVKADQGTVDYDQTQLSYCHITSPLTGRVGLRLIDPGNTIFSGSSSTLVVITQLQPITVVFNVSEDDLAQVQTQLSAGHKLQVAAFDRAGEKQIATGALTSLDNAVDTTTGTIKFRAEFPNSKMELFPNQFVNARLLVNTLRQVTLVPLAAVQHNGTAAFVYVVTADNTVSVQNVTELTSDDQSTAVTGLNAGVNVATSGFDRLENGVQVAVRGQGAGAGAGAQKSTKSTKSTGGKSAGGKK